jgi:hypothetical protein
MSKIQELRQAQAELAVLEASLEALRPSVEKTRAIIAVVRSEAAKYGLDLTTIALELVPNLAKLYGQQGAKPVKVEVPRTRKPRALKTFVNPHTGEKVETKGGNHKVLGEWKKTYGTAVVEGWYVK